MTGRFGTCLAVLGFATSLAVVPVPATAQSSMAAAIAKASRHGEIEYRPIDRPAAKRNSGVRIQQSRGFFSRLFAGRSVTIAINKADLKRRDRMQSRFFRELIWRYYGRNSWVTKKLTKRLDKYYGGLIRYEVVRQIRSRHSSVYPFGIFVDRVVARIAKAMEKTPDNITRYFSVTVPRRFFVDRGKMRLEIEVVKARVPRLDVYQWYDGRRQLVFRSLAAPGNAYKNFGTPNGILYTSRFIGKPRWYPCVTKWAKDEKCRQPRGINTAFGLGGMDLTRRNYLVGYGPKFGNGAVSSYLIHSTNKYASPGRYMSHGCVRLFPHKADELFRAVVHYYRSGPIRTRDFGDIVPFSRTIPVLIGSPAQLAIYRRQLRVGDRATASGN